jgi:hypothetical protein
LDSSADTETLQWVEVKNANMLHNTKYLRTAQDKVRIIMKMICKKLFSYITLHLQITKLN